MSKVTIDELAGQIKDPLLSDNSELVIANPPVDLAGADQMLRVLCKTNSKPQATLGEALVEGSGHTLRFGGRKEYSGAMSIEYNENRELAITTILEQWVNKVRDHQNQTGGYKSEYATDAELRIFDQKGEVVKKYKIVGIFPKSTAELQFDGTGAVVPVSAEFSYDYYEEMA